MNIGASKAAKIANVARSTIYKDMDDGKLSFTIGSKGKKIINVSELERVYGNLNLPDNKKTSDNVRERQNRTVKKDSSDSVLSVEIKMLREQIQRVDQMNERERDRLEKQIEDLRADRDKWREQSSKLLITYENDKKANLQKIEQSKNSNSALIWLMPFLSVIIVGMAFIILKSFNIL